jgi:hypothetical protein
MWTSILLTKLPKFEALRAAVSRVFGVDPSDVQVITPSSTRNTSAAKVVVDVAQAQGDFAAVVEVYSDPDLERYGSLEGLAVLCSQLGISAFMGDDSGNPASGSLVSETGEVTSAMIDPEAENAGEYRLLRRR